MTPALDAVRREELRKLEAELRPFVLGNLALEQILWGDLADDAIGTITATLGDFRRARALLPKASVREERG